MKFGRHDFIIFYQHETRNSYITINVTQLFQNLYVFHCIDMDKQKEAHLDTPSIPEYKHF
jgi:hypothetical protein